MRGLDIRISFAKGLVAASIFGDASEHADDLWFSLDEAYVLGREEYREGVSDQDLPVMFEQVSRLRRAWRQGWVDAAESDDMRHCLSCQSDICPVHGQTNT